MPTYLCHGFKWARSNIRIFVILHNLDDASPEWIIKEGSATAMLEALQASFDFIPRAGRQVPPPVPEKEDAGDRAAANATEQQQQQPPPPPLPLAPRLDAVAAQSWSPVRLLEAFDPADLTAVSSPHAYVADYAVRVDVAADLAAHMAHYEAERARPPDASGGSSSSKDEKDGAPAPAPAPAPAAARDWLAKLRDQMQPGTELGWHVVVNGDEARDYPREPRPAVPPKEVRGRRRAADEVPATPEQAYRAALAAARQQQQRQKQQQQQQQQPQHLQQPLPYRGTPERREGAARSEGADAPAGAGRKRDKSRASVQGDRDGRKAAAALPDLEDAVQKNRSSGIGGFKRLLRRGKHDPHQPG